MEEIGGGHDRDVAVLVAMAPVLGRGLWEQELVEGVAWMVGERGAIGVVEVGRGRFPGAAGDRLGAEWFGPAADRFAEFAVQEPDHRRRDVERRRVGLELGGIGSGSDEREREVADDLGRRGDLDQTSEDPVRRGIHVLDLFEAFAEPSAIAY